MGYWPCKKCLTEIPRILLIVAVHRMAGGSPESLPECLPDNTCFDICMDALLNFPLWRGQEEEAILDPQQGLEDNGTDQRLELRRVLMDGSQWLANIISLVDSGGLVQSWAFPGLSLKFLLRARDYLSSTCKNSLDLHDSYHNYFVKRKKYKKLWIMSEKPHPIQAFVDSLFEDKP